MGFVFMYILQQRNVNLTVTKVKHLIRETNGDKAHWLFPHPVLNYWITHGIHLIFVNLMVVEIEIIIDNFLYPFTSFNN